MRIVQITDIHCDPANPEPRGIPGWDQFLWSLEAARSIRPDLVVITGDLALEQGSPEIYRGIASSLKRLETDYILLPGNHDRREDFHSAFGRRYRLDDRWPTLDRVIETGGISMLLVDTADHVIHGGTLEWVDTLLASYAYAADRGDQSGTVMVWMHHPPLTGFHRFMDGNWALRNGEDFLQICRRYRKRLTIAVFCGHYHTQHTMKVENVTQYCTPSTWVQLDPDTPDLRYSSIVPAIRLVDIDGRGRISSTVIEPVQ